MAEYTWRDTLKEIGDLEALLDDIQESGVSFEEYEVHGMRLNDTVSNGEVAKQLYGRGVVVAVHCHLCSFWKPMNKGKTFGLCDKGRGKAAGYTQPKGYCDEGERKSNG